MTIYLYIKQHSITGLKYFGVTRKKNPFKYFGSGSYWIKHIKKHGKQYVKTLEVYGFDNQKLCTEFALKFSKDNNIVESSEWANQIDEDGKYIPNMKNFKMKEKSRIKISNGCKNQLWWNNGTIQIRSKTNPGSNFIRGKLSFSRKPHSKETKEKISNSLKGHIPGNKGKPMSEKQKIKLSKKSM